MQGARRTSVLSSDLKFVSLDVRFADKDSKMTAIKVAPRDVFRCEDEASVLRPAAFCAIIK